MKKTQGFTIIEVMVAIAIFGIIAAIVFSLVLSSAKLSRQSQSQVNTAAQVQQIIETIRSSWSTVPVGGTASNYDKACIPQISNGSTLTLPNGYSAKYINLNSRAEPVNQSNVVGNPTQHNIPTSNTSSCTAAPNATLTINGSTVPPPMRRVIVSSGNGPQDTTLTIDVLRPK